MTLNKFTKQQFPLDQAKGRDYGPDKPWIFLACAGICLMLVLVALSVLMLMGRLGP